MQKGLRGNSIVIFQLSPDGNVLNPIPEIPPAFDSNKLMCHVLGGRSFNFKDETANGTGTHHYLFFYT